MGKAPFTMKGFSYPGKSPIRFPRVASIINKETVQGNRVPGNRGFGVEQAVTTGSAGQVPIGGSSGIDFGQTVRGAVGATLGFGGSGGGGSATNTATGAIGGYFMGGIGSGLFGKRQFGGQRRQLKTTRGKRGYELSTGSWEDTKPGYVSGTPSFMTS